jgi:hypothetical protein
MQFTLWSECKQKKIQFILQRQLSLANSRRIISSLVRQVLLITGFAVADFVRGLTFEIPMPLCGDCRECAWEEKEED